MFGMGMGITPGGRKYLAAPTNLHLTGDTNSITATWTDATNALNGYTVILDGVIVSTVSQGVGTVNIPFSEKIEPVYSALTDSLLFTDNFSSYADIAAFAVRYPIYRVLNADGTIAALGDHVSLVLGRGGAGQALRLAYGMDNASDIIVGTADRLTSIGLWNGTLPLVAGPYYLFTLQLWLKFSAGADPAAFNNAGVKGVMEFTNGPGASRFQAAPHRLEDFSGGSGYTNTRWDVGPPHPPNLTTKYFHWRTADGKPPLFSTYADGAYHRFTMKTFISGHSSGNIGRCWWMDGTLIYNDLNNIGDFAWETDYGSVPGPAYMYVQPITYHMVFGNYVNETAALGSPNFTVDFDDWSAWTRV